MYHKKLFFSLIACSILADTVFAWSTGIPEVLSEYSLSRLSPSSYNRYYRNVYSQSGEDGILEEVFKRMGIQKGCCIEFGAADGVWFSNTRHLWQQGWSGVMIEADVEKFAQLTSCYQGDPNMVCLQGFVGWKDGDLSVDQIAKTYFPDREVDFLSIDIDGADYLILEFLQLKPKVICVESGLHWHPLFTERIPDEYAVQNCEQPLSIMIDIAKKKGYEPLCLTGNLILIRNDYFHLFSNAPSDVLTIWRDGWRSSFCREWLVTYRKNHPFIMQLEGESLQNQCPIGADF